MTIVSSVVVFILIWWCVLFCVLPLGLATEFEDQGPHAAPGSPRHINMKQKLLLTTVVSVVLFGIAYGLIASDVLNLSELLDMRTV